MARSSSPRAFPTVFALIAPLAAGAAFAAFSASPAGAASPERIDVRMTNFAFAPESLRLHHGQTYVLHLVNDAGGGHSFQAPAFFAEAAPSGPVAKGAVEVEGGQSVDVTVTPSKAGTYPLKCGHLLHPSLGMTGEIVVD